jgi:hypothetical protein
VPAVLVQRILSGHGLLDRRRALEPKAQNLPAAPTAGVQTFDLW